MTNFLPPRAWLQKTRTMRDVYEITYTQFGPSIRIVQGTMVDELGTHKHGTYDLMRPTGLQAYDGKAWRSLYEKDILFKHGAHSVVEWSGINLTRRLMTPKGIRNYIFQEIDLKDCGTKLEGYRLVGNVFENPELIKK